MTITLDGRRTNLASDSNETLHRLVDRIRELIPIGRMIVAVCRNGRTLNDSELEAALDAPLTSEDRVDLISAERGEVAAAALRQVAGQIEAVGQEQAAVAELLNTGRSAEGITRFAQFISVWQTTQRVILECCGVLNRDLTREPFGGGLVADQLNLLVDHLRELRSAFEARDLVAVADLIHYELAPLCDTWRKLLSELADRVDSTIEGAENSALHVEERTQNAIAQGAIA